MFKKARKSIAWLAVLVLALSIFAGYFASIQFSAFAADKGVGFIDMFSGQVVEEKVKYGDKFNVPVDAKVAVTVKAPNGSPATIISGEVTANQLGTYEVTVKSSSTVKTFYKYNVKCYLDGDYILVVDKGGAMLPSYWQASDSKKIKLPDANVYVYDEDAEEYVKEDSQEVKIRVTSPEGNVTVITAEDTTDKGYVEELVLNTPGKWFFTYYTQVEGETNVISQEYVTQVQKQFDDETAPTLSVSNVPATASINTKVTIPTAIVSDNYDSKVIVDISVKHRYNTEAIDVPMTVIDKKTGYVTTTGDKFKDKDDESQTTSTVANAASAIFDNSRFMSFYPTEAGSYTVTYQAQDTTCFYKINTDSSKNASVKYVYTIVVTDTTAPAFDSIDDYKIPTEWGDDVYMFSDSDEDGVLVTDKKIHFPIPEVYDNSDASENLTISFNFTDNGGRTVASFDNINSTVAAESRYIPSANLKLVDNTNGLPYYFFRYEGKYNKATDGLLTPVGGGDPIGYDFPTAFHFGLWQPSTTNTTATKHGNYSITYRAFDGARNFQSKNYSINFSTQYKDLVAPDVRFNVPNFIAFTTIEEEVKINDVRVTDSSSSRLNSEYYVVFNSTVAVTESNFDTVISTAKTLRLDSTLGSNTLKVQNVKTAKTDPSNCQVTAMEYDGIEKTVENIDTTKPIYVAVRATDSVGNKKVLVKEITAIDATVSAGKTCTITSAGLNANDAERGEEYRVGNFTIDFAGTTDRKQTGFEIYVQRVADIESNGDYKFLEKEEAPLTNMAFETYSANDAKTNKVYIDNVRFTPSNSGVYMLVVRGYHISGKSDVQTYYIEAGGTNSGGGLVGANTIPQKGDVNTTYTIASEFEGETGSYVVRSISGGRMSLMFDQLTAKSGTVYSLMDYTVMPDAGGRISYEADTYKPKDNGATKAAVSKSNYTFEASDNAAPSIKPLSIMPTYAAKGATVTLPEFSATSANGIVAKVTCEISDGTKNVPKTQLPGNVFKFEAESDGVYTVRYSATINGNSSSAEYRISVGDVVPPTFKVIDYGFATSNSESIIGYINDVAIKSSQSSNITATIGDTFTFGYISVQDLSRTGYTYSKQLVDPSGENADQTSSYSAYGNKVTFSTAGYYTVKYIVTDENGNETPIEYKITVTSSTVNFSTEAITTLSIVLIIIGVALVAGVIIYLVRFRKHKRA